MRSLLLVAVFVAVTFAQCRMPENPNPDTRCEPSRAPDAEGMYPEGSMCTIQCEPGTTIEDGETYTRTCDRGYWGPATSSGGTATSTGGVCTPQESCARFSSGDNEVHCDESQSFGTATGPRYRMGATCTVFCNSASGAGSATMTCEGADTWTGPTLTCSTGGECSVSEDASTAAGFNAEPFCGRATVAVGESCVYKCADGFYAESSGPSTTPARRCASAGVWDGPFPSCRPVDDSGCTENPCDQGTCDGGVCVCHDGFRGETCSERKECIARPLPEGVQTADYCFAGRPVPAGTRCPLFCRYGYRDPAAGGGTTTSDYHATCRGENADDWFANMPGCVPDDSEPPSDCSIDCRNGGTCVDNTCSCAAGYEGPRCEYPVCDLTCNGNGECVPTTTGGTRCECYDRFSGEFCDSEKPTCPEDHCKNGGHCFVDSNKINCRCEGGYSGPTCETPPSGACEKRCGANGVCVRDGGVEHCECFGDWSGEECNVAPRPCDIFCGRGTCVIAAITADGLTGPTCICPPGYSGANCQIPPPNVCSVDCENGGVCYFERSEAAGAVAVEQKCRCPPGWTGARCHVKSEPDCTIDCGHGVCVSVDGTQTCRCYDGFESSAPDSFCDTAPSCDLNCGSNGRCVRSSPARGSTEHCVCRPGVYGDRCQFSPPVCDLDCGENGKCTFLVRDVDDAAGVAVHEREAVCHCRPGYSGRHCEIAPPRECTLDCVNGICLFTDATSTAPSAMECHCRPGYSGDLCETPDARPTCPDGACLNGGVCVPVTRRDGTVAPQCRCRDEFSGPRCEVEPPVACDCSGHGHCRRDFATGASACVCDSGYAGDACQYEVECPSRCNNRGRCVEDATGRPVCDCAPGYGGEDCSYVRPVPCRAACEDSGHGRCDETTGTCECEAGYTGPDCAVEPPTPVECPRDCSGNGRCDRATGECECFAGWTGDACEVDKCSQAGVSTCARCSAIDECVWCPSSGRCFASRRFPFELGVTDECDVAEVTTRPTLCDTEEIDDGVAPATDPVPTRSDSPDDAARFRLKIDPADVRKCLSMVATEGNPCLSVKRGSPPSADDYDDRDCATDTRRALRVCVDRLASTTGRRMLQDDDVEAAVTGPGAGELAVVDDEAATGTDGTDGTTGGGESTTDAGADSTTGASGAATAVVSVFTVAAAAALAF